jgi:hypothetical protein
VDERYRFVRTSQETYYVSTPEPNRLIRAIDFPYLTGNTLSLRCKAQPANKIHRFVRTSQETHYVSAAKCNRLIRSIDLSVPHRKTLRLRCRAQPANKIYRFVRTSPEILRLRYRAQPANKIYRFARTSQETHYVSAAEGNRLIRSIGLSVPQRKHYVSLQRVTG